MTLREATQEGYILGHLAFSPVARDGLESGWWGLGPVKRLRPSSTQGETARQAAVARGAAPLPAVPEASPSRCFGLSLAITFPLNMLLGLPLHLPGAPWARG